MPRYRSEQTRARDAAYRAEHREEAKARVDDWKRANPEKRRDAERRYREANREKIAATKKAYAQNNRDRVNAINRRWKMNRRLAPEEFDALLIAQGGVCAVCGQPDHGRKDSGRLAIDHCHATGTVRGLLCHRCNSMLGLAKDSTETLKRAIAYLEAACERHQGGGVVRGDERSLLES